MSFRCAWLGPQSRALRRVQAWHSGSRPACSLSERELLCPPQAFAGAVAPTAFAPSGTCRSSDLSLRNTDHQCGTARHNFGCLIPGPAPICRPPAVGFAIAPRSVTGADHGLRVPSVRRRRGARRERSVGAPHARDIKGREGALVPPKRSAEEVVAMLREIERLTGEGMPGVTVCREQAGDHRQDLLSLAGALRVHARGERPTHLQTLEQENARLKRLAADRAARYLDAPRDVRLAEPEPGSAEGSGRPLGPPLRDLRAQGVRARRPEPVHAAVTTPLLRRRLRRQGQTGTDRTSATGRTSPDRLITRRGPRACWATGCVLA